MSSSSFSFEYYDYVPKVLKEYVKKGLGRGSFGKIKSDTCDFKFCFAAVDKKLHRLVGVIYGKVFYGGIRIKELVIDKAYRRNKLGAYLVKKALEFAKNKGVVLAFLETFSFQARAFYEKLGFTHEFDRVGFGPNGEIAYHYFRKDLSDNGSKNIYKIKEEEIRYITDNFELLFFDELDGKLTEFIVGVYCEYTKDVLGGWTGDIAPFAIVLKNGDKTVGFVFGQSFYGGLQIQEFVVNAKSLPAKSLPAKSLLKEVVAYAKSNNFSLIFANTFHEKTKEFYEQYGFAIQERAGYRGGKKMYYLTQML